MHIPQGIMEDLKDKRKGNFPVSLLVITHKGFKFYFEDARYQYFKEAVYLKFFSSQQSYACPDIQFSKTEGKVTPGKSWEAGALEGSGKTTYVVYLPNDYELYPVDIRGDLSRDLFTSWKRAVKAFQEKQRFAVKYPEGFDKERQDALSSVLAEVSKLPEEKRKDAFAKLQADAYGKLFAKYPEAQSAFSVEQEQLAAQEEMNASFAALEKHCTRENVFFEPQMTASATQTLITGFAAIYEYMKDKLQENMILMQAIGLIVVCLVLFAGAFFYYDAMNKGHAVNMQEGAKMVTALPEFIKTCAKAGFINLTTPGV